MSKGAVRLKPEIELRHHFSYSQLSTYLICPMKYAHSYVWGTPREVEPVALDFGTAIHRAVAAFYEALMKTKKIMPLDQMIAAFEDSLKEETSDEAVELAFKEGETLESLRLQGIELVKLFHAEVKPQKVVAVEYPFQVTVPDVINGGDLPIDLKGYLDVIECDDKGTHVIGELKTSSMRFSNVRLEYDLQPTVYSYAMTKMNLASSAEDSLIRYDVLLKTKKPAFERYFVTRSAKDHERLIHLINQVLRAIENRLFYRHLGWQCDGCQFHQACLS